jgi:transcriptional accessory protein Tex/SPT6
MKRISLGLKQLAEDPWASAIARYEVGQVRHGRVTRHAQFGAFVELEPGIEGLAHASTFAPTGDPGGWARSLPIGWTGAVEVLNIDAEKRRIGLAVVPEGSSRAASVEVAEAGEPGQSRADRAAAPGEAFGSSLADKLRDALKPRQR